MSTRKIEDAIQMLQAVSVGSPIIQRVVEDALKEVSEIKSAARLLRDCRLAPFKRHSPRGVKFYPAMQIINSIAEGS